MKSQVSLDHNAVVCLTAINDPHRACWCPVSEVRNGMAFQLCPRPLLLYIRHTVARSEV